MRRHARSGSFICSCIQAGVQGIIMDTALRRRRERKKDRPTQEVPFPVVLEQQFLRGHATLCVRTSTDKIRVATGKNINEGITI